MPELRKASPSHLRTFLCRLSETCEVLVTQGAPGAQCFEPLAHAGEQTDPSGARAVEPLKAFLFPARQAVAAGFSFNLIPPKPKPLCLAGVKACDIRALRLLDEVFLEAGGRSDPYYQRDRSNLLIISADCTEPLNTCFCPVFGGNPWPEEGFDLNLTPLAGQWLIESGSDRGDHLLARHPDLLTQATDPDARARTVQREQIRQGLQAQTAAEGLPHQSRLAGAMAAAWESPLWEEEAQACVECGACNTICPTCHCFLLYDQESSHTFTRFRTWDSCLLKDFARVAGGGNPRPRLWMRLRNRFMKKFDFFPRVAGIYACTGCGRCIDACPAQIDIRRILRKVSNEPRVESLSTG